MSRRPGLLERLRRFGPFAGLTEQETAALLASARVVNAEPGTRVIGQEGLDRDYMVLLEGELEVWREWTTDEGRIESEVGRIRPGEGVGEMALLAGAPRVASVYAVGPSRLLRVDGEAMDELLSWSQHLADHMRADAELRGRMNAVRQSRAFRSLPLATLQCAVERMRPVEVAAGETVFQQGEKGDAYYMVEAGELEVRRDGALIATLGPAATFGEEALLLDLARNATIVARGAGRLWRLAREDFEESVKAAMIEEIAPEQARAMVEDGRARWLDCRYESEYRQGHLRGARLLPLERLREGVAELDPAATHLVYCRSGTRSACAAFLLRERGLKALALAGGLQNWPFPY